MSAATQGHLGTEDDVILARVGAFLVDHVVSILVSAGLGLGVAVAIDSPAGVWIGAPLGYFGYFVVAEAWTGQTVGKRLAGVVVVSDDGSAITLRQSLARNVLRIVDGFLSYAVGLVVMLVTDRRKRLGDMYAGTVVVRAVR